MTLRILILSAGSLCAHNLLSMLEPWRSEYVVMGTNSIAEAPGPFLCDAAFKVPPARDEEAYAAALLALIEAESPDIVVPCREEDVTALARLRASYSGAAVLLAGSLEAAQILENKRLTASFARDHNLPFAETADNLADATAFAERFGYPLIAKPIRGNGSRGITLLLERAHLEQAFAIDDMIVQPFLDGPIDLAPYKALLSRGLPFIFSFPEPNQYSFQIIIGADGSFSEPYASRNTMVMGRPERSERWEDRALIAAGTAYAEAIRALGWRGPFNAQFKRVPDGSFVGFELNGRITGSSAARALSGFNEWLEILARFNLPTPSIIPRTEETRIVHGVLTHYPVPQRALETFEATGVWRRSS